ncbi:nuclear transport factor 2 family protein [Streptomyces sp. H39-S7]|uniref:nuclear transport factor 2 family protein n=1 Tax=Streptomyces sp. H39-S7 TaxID=3004357 RepID=UPI0022AF84C3|nr:nuclear transport factor 2 family protein [Streptomyces sp. H39-S7]MCZ4123377.1 nuclear transport factor 2 family protein [Streptomyces sp. H39-S7]
MSDTHYIIERYLATWNETDPAARRAAIDELWADDANYTDPLVVAEGRDAIDATIGAVQAQFPGLVFTLGGPVDAHHGIARFTWELGPAGGESLVIGFDVAVLTEDGRLRSVLGFLDKVPAA